MRKEDAQIGTRVAFDWMDKRHTGTVLMVNEDHSPVLCRIGSIEPEIPQNPEVNLWVSKLRPATDAPDRPARFQKGDHVRLRIGGRDRTGVVLNVIGDGTYSIHQILPEDALGVPIRLTDAELAPA